MNVHIVWMIVLGGWCTVVPLLARHRARLTPWATIAVTGWLLNAATWAFAAASGAELGGFPPAIVLLTAAHFLFAGAGASALLALTGARRALVVHQVGMITVAAGINGWTILEPVGAAIVTASMATLGRQLFVARRELCGWRRVATTIGSVTWVVPMTYALRWALAQVGALPHIPTLDDMVARHGSLNALVVVVGLAALAPTAPARPQPEARAPRRLADTTPLETAS